ncbi:retrovirus-related pol polyprotein from transposon TNT 1-94 [Tanacetum coccineum]
MSHEKEVQIKFYKTREDKEIEKVTALENKVKALDDIVYKTGQSVQTMNMLNRNYKTSFVKPEFLKKAQRANPRLYDIGCYNDNLALMFAPESDENLAQESRSKLSDLIRPFDYNKTKMPMAVPISTREPKRTVNQSVATPLRRTVASESTNQKPRSTIRKLYEHVSKTCSWWYPKFTPSGYKWKPKSPIVQGVPLYPILHCLLILLQLVEIILFIVDSGCSKHMTRNLKLLSNFVEKFLGTVKFGNDQIAPIIGYEDLVQGNITIKRVYYVEGLNQNLFSVGQLCDVNLEVAFRKSTYYIRDLKGNDLLTSSRGKDLYSITLQDTSTPNPICLMAKATSSQAWLWHRRISHLNFDSINLLLKNDIVIGLPKLKFVKDHLCSSCDLGKAKQKYTWTHFLRSKDETLEVLIDFLKLAQRGLHAQAEEIATTCFTQNRSLVIPRHEKTPYHIINGRKPSVKFFHLFGSLCYIIRDGENLDKMKEKAETVTTSNELDLLFSLIFDELLNGTTLVMSKSSIVTATDAPNQRQQQHTTRSTLIIIAADTPPLNIQITPKTTSQAPTQAPTVTANENIIQAETSKEYAQVDKEEFINIFSTPVQERGKTSSRHVDSSNMHTFYQRHPSEHHWTKDHPLAQVIRNPSQSIRTRCQLETDGEMCMFALTVSRTGPKNIKEAMADFAWIKAIQEELH